MKIAITATPDFRFEAKNEQGDAISIGASKDIGGHEDGFRPMQLLAAAVGSCAGIDVVNILKRSRVEFTGIDIEVNADRKPNATPAPFTNIEVIYRIHGQGIDRAKAERAVSLAIEKYCSVSASLDPAIQVVAKTVLDA
jgi:putative redox protein